MSATAPGPLFVVGNSRSGTTMMGRILGRHPEVFTFRELHFIEELWAPESGDTPLDVATATRLAARLLAIQRHDYLLQGDPDHYRDEAATLVAGLGGTPCGLALLGEFLAYEARRHGKSLPCDQTPRNIYFARLLLEHYPDAWLINMIRDPRDVLLSQKNRWKRRRYSGSGGGLPWSYPLTTWTNYHPITISLLWRSGVGAALDLAGHPRFVTVLFEDLVSRPEATVRALCARLELDFHADMLEVPRVGSSSHQDEPGAIGIDGSAAGRFRAGGLSAGEIALSERITLPAMRRFDYGPTGTRAPLGAAWLALQWPVKTLLALLLNARRSRNLLASIRRRLRG